MRQSRKHPANDGVNVMMSTCVLMAITPIHGMSLNGWVNKLTYGSIEVILEDESKDRRVGKVKEAGLPLTCCLCWVYGAWQRGSKGRADRDTSACNSVPATHVNGIVLHVRLQNSRAKLLLAWVSMCQKPGCWGSIMIQRPFSVRKHPREAWAKATRAL